MIGYTFIAEEEKSC